ncbi:hypothetical protein B0H14DRAFT_2585790 [Mycena olivaceomarginata]|nr:hypothetical protein B0H14DRAFT_2585790 [Mycena olivaceomarginata]
MRAPVIAAMWDIVIGIEEYNMVGKGRKVSSWNANAGEEKLKMDTPEMKHPRRDTFFVICAPCTLYVCDSVGCDGRKYAPRSAVPRILSTSTVCKEAGPSDMAHDARIHATLHSEELNRRSVRVRRNRRGKTTEFSRKDRPGIEVEKRILQSRVSWRAFMLVTIHKYAGTDHGCVQNNQDLAYGGAHPSVRLYIRYESCALVLSVPCDGHGNNTRRQFLKYLQFRRQKPRVHAPERDFYLVARKIMTKASRRQFHGPFCKKNHPTGVVQHAGSMVFGLGQFAADKIVYLIQVLGGLELYCAELNISLNLGHLGHPAKTDWWAIFRILGVL